MGRNEKMAKCYEDDSYIIRNLEESDIPKFVEEEIAQGWNANDEKHRVRLRDWGDGKCIPLVAEYEHSVAGYINLYFHTSAGPFLEAGYPEIVDFAVLEKYRGHGVGSKLMDVAEKIGFQHSDIICIGVGLHSGYGSAQRMYVKRGYIPDGSGVWYKNAVCEPYGNCCNDDDLVLYFSKGR